MTFTTRIVSNNYISSNPDIPVAEKIIDGRSFQGVVLADSSGNVVSNAFDAVGDGSQVVSTAGIKVQLSASSVPCRKVEIVAKSGNTGTIWIGGSTVAAGRGRPLVALQSMILEVSDLNLVYLDTDTSGEGVTYIYFN